MKQFFLSILVQLSVSCLVVCKGQDSTTVSSGSLSKWEHNIVAGVNIGASTPVPIPNNIRKVISYSPEFNPKVGYELLYHFDRKWGIGLGAYLDYKGMKVEDEVLYLNTILVSGDAEFKGTFSGKNQTTVRNAYVSFPIHATYDFNERWRVRLGMYGAWLFSSTFKGTVADGYIRNGGPTGEKVLISEASFDFSKEVNAFDFGVHGGGQMKMWKNLALNADLSWGLVPLFPSSFEGTEFKIYNVYGLLGLVYKL